MQIRDAHIKRFGKTICSKLEQSVHVNGGPGHEADLLSKMQLFFGSTFPNQTTAPSMGVESNPSTWTVLIYAKLVALPFSAICRLSGVHWRKEGNRRLSTCSSK